MGFGPRIVFLIDRYQGENHESSNNKIIANINLSCMRILSYYKHSYSAKGVKSSISWGYKFFNSSKHHSSYHYKRYQFFEYATCNFDKFENELYEGMYSYQAALPQQKMNPGEKLKVALTEIITDFQWDQPELFSPGKLWKRGGAGSSEIDHNFLFLFTSCPSVFHDRSSYFDECYEDDKSFVKCLFPEVLFKKFIKHLKIKLIWVDTGSYISTNHLDGDHDDHSMIENGLRAINGCLIEMIYLSSWWVYTGKNKEDNIYNDILNVSSLVGGLLDNTPGDQGIHISRCILSHGTDNNASISLCPIFSEEISTKHTTEIHSIHIIEVVDLKLLPLNVLNSEASYFYVVNHALSESNKSLFLHLHQTYLSEKVIQIEFTPPDSREVRNAFMVPYTLFCGTIILFSKQIICNSNSTVSMTNCEEDELDDITKELESELHRCLSSKKQDFGSSLANIVDTWFLSNPKLGFPIEIKNILCSLCDDRIAKKKKREENSKLLVEYMKGVYSKLKSTSKSNKKTKSITSLGKRRLVDYRNELKKEKDDGNSNGDIDVPVKEEVCVSSVIVKLDSEVHSEDTLNDCISAEYQSMLQRADIDPEKVKTFLSTITRYYKTEDAESYKESCLSFLNSLVLRNVEDIRDKNIDTPKEELVKEYLLQVHLYLECVHQLNPPDIDHIMNQVVSFLRTVSFEKSTAFISKHLNEKVLPRYQEMTDFLHEVYDNLMLDFPEDLDESKDTFVDDSVSVKSVGSSSAVSHCSSEYSPLSFQAEKRTIKRLPSIVSDNLNKKVIAVQAKKPNNKNKGKIKKSSESSSADKVVKRTLFSQNPPTSNVLATPKPRRRYSESVLKKRVPDTPETKQINDMMWKKLERKRRYSNIDKKMLTIEESPLKEIASPIKRHSSFYRSSSFNCHTSPRRFYTIQRHPSMLVGNHGFSKVLSQEELKSNLMQNDVDVIVSASPMEVKLRRRSTLFSNFDNEGMEVHNENQVVPTVRNENDERHSKSVSRRKIFDIESTPVKQKQDNVSTKLFEMEEQEHKRRKLSPNNVTVESMDLLSSTKEYRNNKLARYKSDMSGVIENIDTEQPVFMSETTVDWLSEIEKDQSKTPTNFHDAFAMLSDTPPLSEHKQSPAIVKAGNLSIKVSPCLSASSIERLENAPILSPVIKRKVSRRKGRLLNL